jgi:hypothetical protein
MADIIRQLRYIQEKYKNDIVSTGRVVISDLARDCANEIERLQSENARLKAELDKAVEDLENLIDCHCACNYCANLMPDGACEIANERDKAIKDLVEEDWRNRNE